MNVDNFDSWGYISEKYEKFQKPYIFFRAEGRYENVEVFIPGKIEKYHIQLVFKK